MTDEQNARLRSHGAVETVLDAHPEPLAGLPAAQRAVTDFKAALQNLRDAVRAQADYAPQGEAKEALRDALADAAVPVAQAVAAWAEEQGDLALADQIAFSRTDFTRAREQDALDRAALVHDKASANAEALAEYGVTPAALSALDKAVDTFADALAQPRHAIAERKAHTEAVERLFPEIDRILSRRLDRLVEQLRGTPFYTEYHTARTVVDL